MKVCYIITTTTNCGPVNVVYNTLTEYRKFNVIPTIVTLKPDDPKKSRQKDFERLGVKVKHFFDLKTQKKDILDFIEKEKFDVVHSHGLIPDYINNYLEKKEKIKSLHVSTLHNYPFDDYVKSKGFLLGNTMAIMHLMAIKNLYKVACSKSICSDFNKIGIKTDVIQNGIIFPDKLVRQRKSNQKPTFLYLGRIHKRKNVEFLVKYFQFHPEYDFWIVGDGAEYENIKEQCASTANITVFGKTETPNEFYQKADYYISASTSEGLPLSVLEAMSNGLPCILSDINPHKEVMSPDKGLIFKNNDIDNLDEAIKKVIDSEFDATKIFEETKSKFDTEVMMSKYVDLYKKQEKHV